jgi:hypothetical protein
MRDCYRLTFKLVRRETAGKGGTNMKPSTLLAAVALLGLAACGQSGVATSAATPAAAADMKSRVENMDPTMQPVFAWQQLVAYQSAHPEATPACPKVRRAESRGVIPANVAPNTVYSALAGQLVFSVQCGAQLTTVHDNPHEHWLVSFAPGATGAGVTNCADAHGADQCLSGVQTAAAPATATP